MSAITQEKGLSYKVKDLSQAEWGRQEIILAEKEMPGLMALRQEYKGKKTFGWRKNRRIPSHDDSDRGSDRNPNGIGSGSEMVFLQYLFNPGSCRRCNR